MLRNAAEALRSRSPQPAHGSHLVSARRLPTEQHDTFADESSLSEGTFNALADEVLSRLAERLDNLFDGLNHLDSDVALEADVLQISLPSTCGNGTYVANRQTPNREIWLSSPVSGPWRFKLSLSTMHWVYHRSGDILHRVLENELSDRLGAPFSAGEPPQSLPGQSNNSS
jgi:frataxin